MSRDLTNLFIDETFQYLTQISGSELQDGLGNRITELDITASNSISASHSVTADSSSVSNTSISASYATAADTSISSSYALTASFALNAGGADTGSLLVTASATDATLTFTKGDGSTFDVTVNNVTDSLYSQNTVTTGKNLEGTEILKGTPLYFTGSGTQGNLVGVYLADAGNPDRMPAGGIAGEDIASGAEGVVLLDGYIGGVNTSAFQSGDQVYVAVGGGYTNQRPTGSTNQVQFLGNIEKSHPNNGSGVIQMIGEAHSLPNIQQGYAWVGDANDVPQPIPTSSFAGDSFPYTGSAEITGSLGVTGSLNVDSVDSINLTGNQITLTDTSTTAFNCTTINTRDFNVVLTETGSNFGNFSVGYPGGPSLSLGIDTGSYGSNPTISRMSFTGDDSFFQAEGNFFIKNTFDTTGSLYVWSENILTLRGDTGVQIRGADNQEDNIDIQGKAFAHTIASNINGFSDIINVNSTVKQSVRAFVETPMQVNTGVIVEIETGATLKVINEL